MWINGQSSYTKRITRSKVEDAGAVGVAGVARVARVAGIAGVAEGAGVARGVFWITVKIP